MNEKLFKRGARVGVALPADIAERYHLEAGVVVEVVPSEEGIFLRPIGVAPWFSVEWERALETVMEWYGEALEAIGAEAVEPVGE